MILFWVFALAVSMLLHLLMDATDDDPGAIGLCDHPVRSPARSPQGKLEATRADRDAATRRLHP
jgi:hypothetical protein